MRTSQQKALADYRRRLRRKGVFRLEVQVRKDDAPLIRNVVRALTDPKRERQARAALRKSFGSGARKGFKALLATAPLDGIDLRRDRDRGRDIEL